MKTIYKINRLVSSLVFCSLITTSCQLDSYVYDKINPSIFPQNQNDALALVIGSAYHPFTAWGEGIFGTGAGYMTTCDMVTDQLECSWGWTTTYNSYEANDWHIDGDWRRIYDYSRYISSMILTIDRIKDVPMPDDLKERYNAELKCGMGFMAFLMYDMYGSIPIPTLETLKKPTDEKILPRLSDEEMRNFIVSNLEEAAEILPIAYPDSEYGHFTKGLANTLLLKFYMLINDWENAEKIGRELTNPKYGYELVSDYHSLFTLSGERNKEVIFSSACKQGVIENQIPAHVLTGDFPTPKGSTITKWGGFKMSWPYYLSYENNDKRLEKIFSEYIGTEGEVHNKKNDRDSGNMGILYYGAVPVKYGFEGIVGEKSEIDVPVYRYADVLGLLAEAIVRNNGSVTQEAVDLLNQVRVTHGGLSPYSINDVRMPELFYDALLHDRGIEFYLEGVRRQDLIRHGKFIEKAVKKAEWAGQPTAKITTIVNGQYKYEKFPIPTKVINEGKGIIVQNPGY